MPGNLYRMTITTRTPYKNKLLPLPPQGSCLRHTEKLGPPLSFFPTEQNFDNCVWHWLWPMPITLQQWLGCAKSLLANPECENMCSALPPSQAPRHHLPSSSRKPHCPPPQRGEARANSQLVLEDGCEKLHFFTHPHNRRSSSVASGRSNPVKQI